MGPLIVTIGILMAYICGAFVEYRLVPYCFMGFPVLFFIVMCFTPETPHKLILKDNIEESLRRVHFLCLDIESRTQAILTSILKRNFRLIIPADGRTFHKILLQWK